MIFKRFQPLSKFHFSACTTLNITGLKSLTDETTPTGIYSLIGWLYLYLLGPRAHRCCHISVENVCFVLWIKEPCWAIVATNNTWRISVPFATRSYSPLTGRSLYPPSLNMLKSSTMHNTSTLEWNGESFNIPIIHVVFEIWLHLLICETLLDFFCFGIKYDTLNGNLLAPNLALTGYWINL